MRQKKQPLLAQTTTAKQAREYRKTIPGLLCQAYSNLVKRSTGRKPDKAHLFKGPIEYAEREEFMKWARKDVGFLVCYTEWVESGHDRKLTPTIFRTDRNKGYTIDNMEFLTASSQSTLTDLRRYKKDHRSLKHNSQALSIARRLING